MDGNEIWVLLLKYLPSIDKFVIRDNTELKYLRRNHTLS